MKINKDTAMLLDVQYVRGNKKQNTPDYLYIIWKDIVSGKKHMNAVPEPKMAIYFEKPEFRNHSYNKTYEHIENLNKTIVPYTGIINAIAEDSGDWGKQKLSQIYQTGNYKELENFKTYQYVFGADYDIRAWYRIQWLQTMENNKPKELTKGFADIEVDSLESIGLPDPEICPIDLVTLIDGHAMKSYTFALTDVPCKEKDMTNMTPEQRQKELKRREMYASRIVQQHNLMNNIDELKKELHDMFDESYGKLDYNFYFYTDERKMIVHIFQLINTIKLDFIQFWNMPFDIPYFIDRIRALGMNPEDVMCSKDFPVKECFFKKDTTHFQVKNKADYFKCSSYTIFTDQMRNYAAIRKGGTELRSTKLNYIAQKEIGDEKLDYSEDGNIKTISYLNYKNYVIYNIKDVLLQFGIEKKTTDLDTFYITSYKNATPYEHVFKQTMKLRNVQYISYLKNGLIPGENINQFINSSKEESEDDDDDSFEGALVGNPILNSAFGMEMYGKKSSSIFHYSIDMDMSSFYPSTIFVMNIDPSTLIFKTIVKANQFDVRGGRLKYHGITDKQLVEKNDDSFVDDVAKEVFDNFQTKNYMNTAHKYFNLPSVDKVYHILNDKFS